MLGSAEDLPGPLAGIATSVSVLFPWGSLLRAAATPEPEFVENLAAVCQPGAALEVVYSLDSRDAAELERLGLAANEPACVAAAYQAGGFELVSIEALDAGAIKAYPTSWARRLANGSDRCATRLIMCRTDKGPA